MVDKVLSIEQMQHLQELGVDTDNASMFHVSHLRPKDEYGILDIKQLPVVRYIPAYTLHDIIEKLPDRVNRKPLIIAGSAVMYSAGYGEGYEPIVKFDDGTLLDNAYNMLCWWAEMAYNWEKWKGL